MRDLSQYPYVVTVPSTQYMGSQFFSWIDPYMWCVNHFGQEGWYNGTCPGLFAFANEQDAVMFALRWS
jgi:hypothetical protein